MAEADLWVINLTASPVVLADLGVIVPGSGSLQLLPVGFELDDLQHKDDLRINIISENLVLSYNGVDGLSKETSLNILEPVSLQKVQEEIESGGDHENFRTLVHELSSNSYDEVVKSEGKISAVVSWTDVNKNMKLREILLTRSQGGKISLIEIKQYDTDGEILMSRTGTIERTGNNVASITWVKS